MSDTVLLEIVRTVGIIATAILSTIAVYLGARARKEQKELGVKVDGRLTELMDEKIKRSELEGHKAGVAEQKAETKIEVALQPPPAPIELKIGKLEVEMKPPEKPPNE